MKQLLLVFAFLVLMASNAAAEVLVETWPDPLGEWRNRWVAQNTNMQNYYVCFGNPDEDFRGNNPCGLWICDGDTGTPDANIVFSPAFGASISNFQIGIESYLSDAFLRVFDIDDVLVVEFPLPATGQCNPDCGCNTLNYAVDTPNGVGRFLITSAKGTVEGNMAIDNMQVTTGCLVETWPDPLGEWRNRWVAQNTNMQNVYVCGGNPDEDNRGNNPCGLWICDGEPGTPDADIIFNPTFGASISNFQIGIECYIPDAFLRVFDIDDVLVVEFPLPATGQCNPDCGCNTLNYAVDTPNGVGRFLITSVNLVEGNMAIDNMRVCINENTGVGENQVATVPLWLEPAAPNPFATATEFAYTLPSAGRLRLSVYDVPGRQVAVLADEVLGAGRHIARWDGGDSQGARLRAGVYFLRLEFAGQTETRKVVLVR